MKFKQLESGTPSDIECTMRISEALQFKSDLEECDAEKSTSYDNVNSALLMTDPTDSEVTFIIPGDEAGENGDLIEDLENYLLNMNEEAIKKFEFEL
jgi:hypothetical protein